MTLGGSLFGTQTQGAKVATKLKDAGGAHYLSGCWGKGGNGVTPGLYQSRLRGLEEFVASKLILACEHKKFVTQVEPDLGASVQEGSDSFCVY